MDLKVVLVPYCFENWKSLVTVDFICLIKQWYFGKKSNQTRHNCFGLIWNSMWNSYYNFMEKKIQKDIIYLNETNVQ